MNTTKYHVVSSEYLGSGDRHGEIVIDVRTAPARKNLSGEICLNGWCGTTNDRSVDAHGEYPSLAAAILAIRSRYPDAELLDTDHLPDDTTVVVYRQLADAPTAE